MKKRYIVVLIILILLIITFIYINYINQMKQSVSESDGSGFFMEQQGIATYNAKFEQWESEELNYARVKAAINMVKSHNENGFVYEYRVYNKFPLKIIEEYKTEQLIINEKVSITYNNTIKEEIDSEKLEGLIQN